MIKKKEQLLGLYQQSNSQGLSWATGPSLWSFTAPPIIMDKTQEMQHSH